MNLSKRQLSLFRGNGGGMTPLQIALAKFGFYAPLTTDVFLDRGYGAASFTRATTATVKDWEGAIRNCLSGEVRFAGQRRVRNLLTTSENLDAWGKSNCTITSGITDPDGGSTAFTMTATAGGAQLYAGLAGNTFRASIWMRRRTGTGLVAIYVDDSSGSTQVTLTTSWQRFSPSPQSAGNPYMSIWLETSGDEVDLWHPMYEEVVGQSNQNPSEYVSVGAAKLNELIQTEDFTTSWTNSSTTDAANSIADPNGNLTADTVTASGANGTILQSYTAVADTYTFSVYLKRKTGTGDIQIAADSGTYTTVVITAAWARYEVTQVVAAGAKSAGIKIVTSGDAVYAWGAQLERASAASTYFPVGSVYPYHGACVDGVKYFDTENGNTVASNVVTEATGAAIDQTGNVGYLAESARTNLVLQSSNFGTTWGALGTPTRSAAAAYCGEIALDLIGDDDAGALEGYDQPLFYTGNATKSISLLVKQGTSTSTVVRANDTSAPADRLLVAITWSGGVPVCTYTTGSAERASEYMGGGVWRIFCLTTSITAANLNYLKVYPATDAALAIAATGDIYIGGVQAENALFASATHIPTTTATATRNADSLTYPIAGNMEDATGSLFCEVVRTKYGSGVDERIIGTSAGVGALGSANFGVSFMYDGTTTVSTPYTGTQGVNSKYAGAYSGSTMSADLDGGAVSNGAFDGSMNCSGGIAIGGVSSLTGVIKNVRVATVRLSDAELQLITQ